MICIYETLILCQALRLHLGRVGNLPKITRLGKDEPELKCRHAKCTVLLTTHNINMISVVLKIMKKRNLSYLLENYSKAVY